MAKSAGNIVICSCEGTMPLDEAAVRRGCPDAQVTTAHQLCRMQIDRFRAKAGSEGDLTVACTQEAPLFEEVAAEAGRAAPITYTNIRETAGWSRDESGEQDAAH